VSYSSPPSWRSGLGGGGTGLDQKSFSDHRTWESQKARRRAKPNKPMRLKVLVINKIARKEEKQTHGDYPTWCQSLTAILAPFLKKYEWNLRTKLRCPLESTRVKRPPYCGLGHSQGDEASVARTCRQGLRLFVVQLGTNRRPQKQVCATVADCRPSPGGFTTKATMSFRINRMTFNTARYCGLGCSQRGRRSPLGSGGSGSQASAPSEARHT
jgi:hypothetical protein